LLITLWLLKYISGNIWKYLEIPNPNIWSLPCCLFFWFLKQGPPAKINPLLVGWSSTQERRLAARKALQSAWLLSSPVLGLCGFMWVYVGLCGFHGELKFQIWLTIELTWLAGV
jgi:hypothetical protein